ncbi:response regulator [Actinoalloteichus hymeniacidonis]|uniref:Two component transcriptional regulator, LuxR family n=1 Tax=Actinoalloteichus hymeniacidonis TaxID=340345 RepID=A0AAC9HR65_9PSEU|nr:response regulator transcription factor [Actinoalloteichus hymeniacidonis]AOS64072.1 two component transcriptional regulator, LuxR family [Actinoalloteichus hymeniacidonis]MBB5907866.1 DNA-binding NarL/FixJ family response regulator [Actinoalloteichus hymeniacidonis]
MAPGLRIVLAEDAVLLRAGLVELLGRFQHRVVAAVGDATALAAAVAEHKPDLIVTDVRMPPGYSDEGLRAAVELRSRYPGLGVLVLTQYVATAYAFELIEADGDRRSGGIGYLLKDRVADVKEFVDAVERIAKGDMVIDPEVVRQLLRRERADRPLRRLTPREHQVLALMAEGRTNAAIAATLFISQAAVSKNIGSIFTKLDLSDSDGNHRVLAVLTYLRG